MVRDTIDPPRLDESGPMLAQTTPWGTPIPPRVNFASERPNGAESIIEQRGKIYGDPKENHDGIAMQWAPMLQPHWEAIRDMKPLPAHVVALLMVLVKVNRMRLVFHEDNFSDAINYMDFARQWQPETTLPAYTVSDK